MPTKSTQYTTPVSGPRAPPRTRVTNTGRGRKTNQYRMGVVR